MYDLLIIGGGINGTAIACDAAGRGLSVLLCEKDDLASHTSSASTKLIHGGLRYLEQYEFKLVRDALREREVLLKKAPHIIWPLEFVMPNQSEIRPYWLVRLGLFLYDTLAGKKRLKSSEGIDLSKHVAGSILKPNFKKGLVYSDCWVDDARLVVLNAIAAKENGAKILTRTKCISAERQKDSWDVTLLDKKTDHQHTVKAKVLINAAGPWVDDVQINTLSITEKKHIILVKGSHIIVPRLHTHDYAYILQHSDKRVLFVIPYLEKYSLIGTTDVVFHDDPNNVKITKEEVSYLCTAVNAYFKKSISPSDVISSYSGVRPLKCDKVDAPADISRDYELSLDNSENQASILNIYGGKITTHRKLAEHAMAMLQPIFPQMGSNWTEHSPLPGGEIEDGNIEKFVHLLKKSFPNLPNENFFRYAKNYGSRAFDLLKNVKTIDDLGEHFGGGLYYKELEYSINKEFSLTSEDVLWRRTKLGFHFDMGKIAKLDHAIQTIHTKK